MSRYINAELVKEYLKEVFQNFGDRLAIDCIVDEIPTADVKEVVCGEWIYDMSIGDKPYCSVCKTFQEKVSRFCPHCGVDMR